MIEERLREALRAEPVPGAREAEDRGWRVVDAGWEPNRARPSGRRRRGALELAAAVAVAALAISPAGAAVRDLVGDAVRGQQTPARPALTSLPAPGALLVDSPRGPWVVRRDGSKRLLGPYRESTWSPHGLFVAATAPHQLLAVDPAGTVRWSLARRGALRDPAWSPDGVRIAYLDGDSLRVVAGDGSGDHLVATKVADVAPAWAPGAGHLLAFVDGQGRVRIANADGGRALGGFAGPPALSAIDWSADGARLLLVTPAELQLRTRSGDLIWRRPAPARMGYQSATISPRGGAAATLSTAAGSRSELLQIGPDGGAQQLFSGLGRLAEVTYSPGGGWLLVAWRSADQWLFLSPRHPRDIVAISDVAAQFDPGATSPPAFPRVSGWCCPAADAGR